MQITTILAPERTLWGVEGCSQKRTLETIAHLIAQDLPGIDADELFRNLIAREKLGSTAIGHGIAIPHCRSQQCTGITGALVQLKAPVDFNAPDHEPVDILFILIVPEEANDAHLTTLAMLAESFMKAEFRESLRSSKNAQELFSRATDAQQLSGTV